MLPNLLDKIHQQPWLKQRYVFTFIGFLTTFTVALLNFHVELIIKYIVRLNRTETDLYDKVSCPNLIVNHSGIIDDQETLLEEEKFTWDEVSVSSILGAYYGGYIWTQWLGGFAAELVGGKLVMIISIITAAILTISTPLVVMFFESYGMSNLRFITGLALGPTIPVLLSMMSKWIPKTQYTFIGSIIFPGALIGQVVAIYLTDFTVRVSGWETVCYIYGLFGLLLSVLWVFFCYSTPNMHPRISETEKEYLNENVISLKRSTKYELDPLPWKAYFFSAALWGVTIGYIGKEWAYHLLTVEIPQFQKEVFRSDISDSLHLTSAPYICMWISAMAFGYSSDFIVKTGFVDYKKARQLFTSVGLIGSGLSIMLSVYSNCAPKHSFLWMCMGMIALGACYSGVFISVLDMTPNYAGSTMGIIDNLGITIAWVIPMLKDWIVPAGLQSQWKLLLWLMLILILVKLAVYLYFTHADQLWWDDVRSYGYPENWKGLFVTNGYIDKDLHNVFKPKKTALKAL